MARKKGKKKNKLVGEILKQLIDESERWGQKDYYTPLKLEEIALEEAKKIRADLLSEKSNLEYEMNMLGTDKREVLLKTQKLGGYIARADKVIQEHEQKIQSMVNKNFGDKATLERAKKAVKRGTKVSVMIE